MSNLSNDNGTELSLSRFAENTKLSGALKMLEGRDAIQTGLDKLRRWICVNLMKFNKAKWKVLEVDQAEVAFSEIKSPDNKIFSSAFLWSMHLDFGLDVRILSTINAITIVVELGAAIMKQDLTELQNAQIQSKRQAKQPKLSQSFFIWLVFQSLHQLCCPSLDTFKHLNVLPKLRGPELDTALKVWPDQCRVQGKNELPAPAAHTIPDTGQNAIGPLGHLGTLLAHVPDANGTFCTINYPAIVS
ncbi:hypothetical protein HGM15179_008552 [Zosterops borbonicus]|uniref:Rna-directed dna polymerase from mobile element jockey-like n=1 Tax=Zosterops borbonicus TaxID=364589 RepID=A0A8K1GIA0_9PASS|nr:hypothetical protein HGM15179_008552 [Zosterops borbonicus]